MFKQRVTKVSKDGKKIVIKSVKLDSDNPEQEGDLEQFPVSANQCFFFLKLNLSIVLYCVVGGGGGWGFSGEGQQ